MKDKEIKSELIYALVVIALMSIILFAGAMYHPRSNYNNIEKIKY